MVVVANLLQMRMDPQIDDDIRQTVVLNEVWRGREMDIIADTIETSKYKDLPHMYHTWIESSYDIHHIERSDRYLVKRCTQQGEGLYTKKMMICTKTYNNKLTIPQRFTSITGSN